MLFSRFLPQEGSFFELFNAHAELIVKGGRELAALVNSLENDPKTLGAHSEAIDEIEAAADTITHETIAQLHKTFNTPLDRDEILIGTNTRAAQALHGGDRHALIHGCPCRTTRG